MKIKMILMVGLIIWYSGIHSILKAQSRITASVNQRSFGVISSKESRSRGTAVVFMKPNYVLACAHEISSSANDVEFTNDFDQRTYHLSIVNYDTSDDLVLLKCAANISSQPFQPDYIKNGEDVFYLGFDPTESSETRDSVVRITHGYKFQVAAIGSIDGNRFVLEGSILHGYSGGPVIDGHGNLVGLIHGYSIVVEEDNLQHQIVWVYSAVPMIKYVE